MEPAKVIITAFCRNVNPLFAKNQKNWVSRVSIGCQRLFAFFNGPKRKQEPHRMRPCLKRQPSKAQGFTAAAVLEEIHRAGSNLSSHTSHIIRRVQQQAAWRFSIKSPGCACLSAVCLIAVPEISLCRNGKNIRKIIRFSEFLSGGRQEGGRFFQK